LSHLDQHVPGMWCPQCGLPIMLHATDNTVELYCMDCGYDQHYNYRTQIWQGRMQRMRTNGGRKREERTKMDWGKNEAITRMYLDVDRMVDVVRRGIELEMGVDRWKNLKRSNKLRPSMRLFK